MAWKGRYMKKITVRFLMIGGTAITLNGLLILNIYAFQWMIDFLTGYQLKKAFIWLSLYFVNLLLISALKYCNTVSLGKMEDYIETEYSNACMLPFQRHMPCMFCHFRLRR